VELSADLRRRALALANRMEDVGELQTSDLRAARLDRRTAHYREALLFARNIITNVGRTLAHGEELVWTFLIRTPNLIEAGVRNAVEKRLRDRWMIVKEPIPLSGADMTVAPDLIIGYGEAIADVKYKLATANWLRADLYEIVAFAEAAGTSRAAVIGFRPPE